MPIMIPPYASPLIPLLPRSPSWPLPTTTMATAAVPGVYHHHLHTHLPALHPADAAGAGAVLLPAVRDPVDGDAARTAETERG